MKFGEMRSLELAVFIGNSRGSLEVAATTVADYNVSIPLSLSVFVFEIALSLEPAPSTRSGPVSVAEILRKALGGQP
jgi:hypothetical protein